jgi:hypothetical protein
MSSPIHFETFPLGGDLARIRGYYDFLADMPPGSHVHFADIRESTIRSAIHLLNRRQQSKQPGFHLAVRQVSGRDPKGPGFRVLRIDRVVTP